MTANTENEIEDTIEAAHTRGLLDARRAYAQAWADVTRQAIHEIDFTPAYLRAGLLARWFERRHLADGTAPAVGQRVVTVREVATRWNLPHANDEHVHEITSLLSGDTHLVECGPQQIGVGMLRLAPEGSEVTCPHCRGWAAQRERWRIDAEVFRAAQFELEIHRARVAELEKTCGEWWAACSSIPAASPHTLRTALREAGEKILHLRSHSRDLLTREADLEAQRDKERRLSSNMINSRDETIRRCEGALERTQDRVAELERLLARSERHSEHTTQWYAVRIERIKDVAKVHNCWPQIVAILANGTVSSDDPVNYARLLNRVTHEAERANERAEAAEVERDELKRALANALQNNSNLLAKMREQATDIDNLAAERDQLLDTVSQIGRQRDNVIAERDATAERLQEFEDPEADARIPRCRCDEPRSWADGRYPNRCGECGFRLRAVQP